MKVLTKRTEIAKAINFNKYPVLSIDLADSDDYGLKGCRVRVDAGKFPDGSPYQVGATLRVFRDEKKLTLQSGGVCISDSFSYSDYVDMVERAQAPLVGPDMDVVVTVYDSKKKLAFPPAIVHTTARVDRHCITPLSFENADFTPYLAFAGFPV